MYVDPSIYRMNNTWTLNRRRNEFNLRESYNQYVRKVAFLSSITADELDKNKIRANNNNEYQPYYIEIG